MSVNVAVNGFGCVGRRFVRMALSDPQLNIVAASAANGTYGVGARAHLLKYDSTYGTFEKDVRVDGEDIVVEDKRFKMLFSHDPSQLPWKDLGVDIVVEASGKFTDAKAAFKHIEPAGAKRVLISAAAKQAAATLVYGVNEGIYDPKQHRVVSMASCTTNCLAPVAKVLNDEFGVVKGLMTTVHAYTNDQVVLDDIHRDLRRARAAACSIIPTTTGAAKAISLVLPELEGKLNGFALRVPTPAVSLVDLVVELDHKASVESVNDAFREAAQSAMKGILGVCDQPLVSVDYKADLHSAVVDLRSTMLVGDNMLKVVAWYDNEWGYCARLLDTVKYMAEKGVD